MFGVIVSPSISCSRTCRSSPENGGVESIVVVWHALDDDLDRGILGPAAGSERDAWSAAHEFNSPVAVRLTKADDDVACRQVHQ